MLLLLGLLCHLLPLMLKYSRNSSDVFALETTVVSLSRVSCILMLIAYLAYLVFQLWTHRQFFEAQEVRTYMYMQLSYTCNYYTCACVSSAMGNGGDWMDVHFFGI